MEDKESLRPSLIAQHYEVWQKELDKDPDREFILSGLRNGFSLIDSDIDINQNVVPVETQNHKSARDPKLFAAINNQILCEMEDDNYVLVQDKPKIVSPLAAIPKPSGGIRLIHDCSLPDHNSLNDYASKEPCSYHTVAEALGLIQPGWYMAKVDLQSAYRAVGIRPSEQCLTGLTWNFPQFGVNPTYFVDRRLPFGARKSAAIFNRITLSVKRMMHRRGYDVCLVVLDDFFLAAESKEQCKEALNCLIRLLRSLGFRINWKKVVGPTRDLVFLGVRIDTVMNKLSLDPTKLNELIKLLDHYITSSRLSKPQLESLIGKLSWASNVVLWGRTQLCNLYAVLKVLKGNTHKVRIPRIQADLTWWRKVLAYAFNCRQIWDMRPTVMLQADSSQAGGGAFCNGLWLYRNWKLDSKFACAHINIKELLIVREAIKAWAPVLAGLKIHIQSDNTSAIAFLNKGTSSNYQALSIIRDIALITMSYNISIQAHYIPGIDNCLADALSRLHQPGQLPRFVSLLNMWFGYEAPSLYWLPAHMSHQAIRFLSPQIKKWQGLYRTWIGRLLSGGNLPLPNQLRLPTDHTGRLTSISAR